MTESIIAEIAGKLTEAQHGLIDWLSREDWSAYGECHGRDFDSLQELALVERKPSNRSGEHEYFDLCRLTPLGLQVRQYLEDARRKGEG